MLTNITQTSQINYNIAHKASPKKPAHTASSGKEQAIQRATVNFANFKAVLEVEPGLFLQGGGWKKKSKEKTNSPLQREKIF